MSKFKQYVLDEIEQGIINRHREALEKKALAERIASFVPSLYKKWMNVNYVDDFDFSFSAFYENLYRFEIPDDLKDYTKLLYTIIDTHRVTTTKIVNENILR